MKAADPSRRALASLSNACDAEFASFRFARERALGDMLQCGIAHGVNSACDGAIPSCEMQAMISPDLDEAIHDACKDEWLKVTFKEGACGGPLEEANAGAGAGAGAGATGIVSALGHMDGGIGQQKLRCRPLLREMCKQARRARTSRRVCDGRRRARLRVRRRTRCMRPCTPNLNPSPTTTTTTIHPYPHAH
eukprot:3219776-Pleurochrysis_carterae.AAC.1